MRSEDALTWERLRFALWPGDDETHGEVTSAYFNGTVKEPVEVLVAEDARGVVIAFVEISIRTDLPCLEHQRIGYVEGLYVVPHMRAQGVALRLLQAARLWSRSQACTGFASDRNDRVIVDRTYSAITHAPS